MRQATPTANTISLIGMPGAGKSTVGVILAKLSGRRFIDTDLDIQVREGATLQDILEREGYRYLRAIEQQVLLDIPLDNAIISTGGSVVYSKAAMDRLRLAGPVIYLEVDLPVLERRVAASPLRGIASDSTDNYLEVFAERTPLYQAHADLTVAASNGCPEDIAQDILTALTHAP
jgi:shikimate kinase